MHHHEVHQEHVHRRRLRQRRVRRHRGAAPSRRGGVFSGVECLQTILYKQALNTTFYNIKEQTLRAAPAPERGGSESIDGSCSGAARAAVAAGVAVAGGARRGATQARRVPHRRLGRPAAAGTRRRPACASRRSAGALRGAAACPPASRAPAAAPRAVRWPRRHFPRVRRFPPTLGAKARAGMGGRRAAAPPGRRGSELLLTWPGSNAPPVRLRARALARF